MQVETQNTGHFMLAGDLYHVREPFEQDVSPGWLGRDRRAWHRSHRWMKYLQMRHNATMVYGHDLAAFDQLKAHGGRFG